MEKLNKPQINRLVTRYIGVDSQGYLGDFSYRTHRDFYPDYCNLYIDPDEIQGTTRLRFITILEKADRATQATILRGVLKRFPPENAKDFEVTTAREGMIEEVKRWIQELELGTASVKVDFQHSCETVMRALEDAKVLLSSSQGPVSAIDRAHTAFHGYLKDLSEAKGLSVNDKTTMVMMLKHIAEHHPAFTAKGHRGQDTDMILGKMGAILDALNPIRNRGSVAHPNPILIAAAEAQLVINTIHTLMTYIHQKISGFRSE